MMRAHVATSIKETAMLKANQYSYTICLLLVVILVSGCLTQSPAPIVGQEPAKQIRQEAEQHDDVVQVIPLSDPAADELIQQAEAAENSGDVEYALTLVDQALTMAPSSPEYLQYRAELALQMGQPEQAIADASKSFQSGPGLGPLCTRNWLTIEYAHRMLDQTSDAQEAASKAEDCHVESQPRF